MIIAVVIPFRGDPGTLQWALEGFARQALPVGCEMEVRVCGDGVELPALPEAAGARIRFIGINADWVGAAEAKNLLLRGKPADVVIFANSDTRPAAGMVAAHVSRLRSLPAGHLVLGAAPYEADSGPAADGSARRATVFDALKSESPMIFFYGQMTPGAMYDFRHGWTLNLSGRYADLAQIGFFEARCRPYGSEDIEMAHRLMGPSEKRIYFEPAARVMHRHPMTFDDYLRREEMLGVMGPALAAINPGLFRELHGPADVAELAGQFREWVRMDRTGHAWIYRRMMEWSALPAEVLGAGAQRSRLLMTLYQMHIPLKRLAFRLGYLRGMELREDGRWRERTAADLWRSAIGAA